MNKKGILSRIRKSFAAKVVAVYMAVSMTFDILYPTCAFALTGGPSQPEVGGFQPIETSDMVDLFSGDFKYNIPLMDMDGYPLNLAYNGGVTMDQEASWVGLGWSLNPGVVNRSMRGVPDDYSGDVITKEFNMKPNRTYSLNAGATFELFGFDADGFAAPFSGTLSYDLGVNYNNYYGVGVEQSLGINFKAQAGPLTGSLGITSSSENGLIVSPNVKIGLTLNEDQAKKTEDKIGFNIGCAINSRTGVKQLNYGVTFEKQSQNEKGWMKTKTDDLFGAKGSFDFGLPTYTPQVSMPMHNVSISANFQVGLAFYGTHPSGYIGASYNGQQLMTKLQNNPAFGYMHLNKGAAYDHALLDFNRENEGEFSVVTPNLPTAGLTYDLYSVSGQGVGGSYRPFRSEIGYVFDAHGYSSSEGYNLGIEVGAGGVTHIAGDFTVNSNNTWSGKWVTNNMPATRLRYGNKGSNVDHEEVYFKEASEKSTDSDPSYYDNFGGPYAARFQINQLSKFNTRLENTFVFDEISTKPVPSVNYRTKRDKRNSVIYQLTRKEMEEGFGVDTVHTASYNAPDHHIAEITSYGTDGMRYVYGIAAYNNTQKEVSFAVGQPLYSSSSLVTGSECGSGLITYNPGVDNHKDNNAWGRDNYYSATTTPPYAHSYLLTAVLSPDYVDADKIKGPSIGDLGYYTKFTYDKKHADYRWRTPVEQNKANYNEGLKADLTDDKASYVYGTKEIWYVKQIESKNYVADFIIEPRKDALGVLNENGGADISKPSYLLRRIEIYSRKEYYLTGGGVNPSRVPIKVAHFEYDYSLCAGVSNFSASVVGANPNETGTGKLTLKKMYFTYQKSNKARLSPYTFVYGTLNPNYNGKSYDRWGNYKSSSGSCSGVTSPLIAPEYPYVDQNQTTANQYTSAWCMSEILLPSGGKIAVDYESDDYAYVQNKRAGQMFKIVGWCDVGSPSVLTSPGFEGVPVDNKHLLFELPSQSLDDITKYVEGIQNVYFKCLMEVLPGKYDYIFGYAELDPSQCGIVTVSSVKYGYIKLKSAKLDDNDLNVNKHPIVRAAVQFSRLYLSRYLYGDPMSTESTSFGQALITEIFTSGILSNIISNLSELVNGPNDYAFKEIAGGDNEMNVVMGKSWIRLNNPNKKKLGGGCRVKKITISDEWLGMTGSTAPTQQYGQEYFYTLEDGVTSSGVASYEPQLGGEENPWKQPITYDIKNALAPDTKMYQEEPLGESFFPSPSVGYSRVTVRNLQRTDVNKHATGKVVHEFYTSKDFPTIVNRTPVDALPEKTDPLSIASLLNVRSKSHLTATQGFSIEVNDMNGKPKVQMVYQEDQTVPITSVEYKYKCSPYGNGSFVLNNTVNTLNPTGAQATTTIGQFFDMVADMREERSFGQSAKLMANLDGFFVLLPIAVPTFWPSFSSEETQFRSATTTKVIQRFGILEETIAKDLGSVVSTKNLAYDSETGDVLVTQTTTNFNDAIYTLVYPAHWYYDKGMGQAYKNIGLTLASVSFSSTGVAGYTNASAYFVPGDELKLSNGKRAWIVEVQPNSFKAVKKDGSAVTGTLGIKVIRSGRRNLAATTVSSITTLSNPLTNFQSNVFANVLQASAIEFTDEWRTFCDCFGNTETYTSVNPYILGTRGNWRTKKSLLHLSPRTQSFYNNNTHIRKDGVFTAYTPYYKLNGSAWNIDPKNWTFTSEVTEFSPFSQELENKDALGRYSAVTFGYRQTFATSVAANARYRDIGFDNFEDYGFSPCADNHFKFVNHAAGIQTDRSHSGRSSMKVSAGSPVTMEKTLAICPPAVICDLSLRNTIFSNENLWTILNGTGPYTITYNILEGDPGVTLLPTGFSLSGNGYKIEVTIVDANGCRLTKTIIVAAS